MTDQTDAPTFEHTRAPTQIYLISPQDVAGDFPDRLAAALDAGLKGRHRIAAFQFRVKGVDEHTAARLAAPLQALCAEREIAFIVNDRSAWPNGWVPMACTWGRRTWPRAAA
jgi:thiamine-phosphate pyrophosphorylase